MYYEKTTLALAAASIVAYLSGQYTLNVFITIALLESLTSRAKSINGGPDGTRTRDLRGDRPAF